MLKELPPNTNGLMCIRKGENLIWMLQVAAIRINSIFGGNDISKFQPAKFFIVDQNKFNEKYPLTEDEMFKDDSQT